MPYTDFSLDKTWNGWDVTLAYDNDVLRGYIVDQENAERGWKFILERHLGTEDDWERFRPFLVDYIDSKIQKMNGATD